MRDNVVPQQVEYFFPVNGPVVVDSSSKIRVSDALVRSVIHELQIDAKILALHHGDHFLQRISILTADPHQVGLNRSLCFLL